MVRNKIEKAMETIRSQQKLKEKAAKIHHISQLIIQLLAEESEKEPNIAMSALLSAVSGMFGIAKMEKSERNLLYKAIEESVQQVERFTEVNGGVEGIDGETWADFERELSKVMSEEIDRIILLPDPVDKETTIH